MKSSMLNRHNIPVNPAEKRLEAIFKKEMRENQHIIECQQKEMQALREALNLSMDRFKSLSERTETELQEYKNEATKQINQIKDWVKADEALLLEHRKMIEDLHQQMLGFYILLASKVDLDKLKKELENKIDGQTLDHINAFQNFQIEMKTLIQSLKNELIKLKFEIDNRLSQLSEKSEANFSISQIDKEGVLREIRAYKQDMFYIEKKIENIYTLIERLNKKVELCPKPV